MLCSDFDDKHAQLKCICDGYHNDDDDEEDEL